MTGILNINTVPEGAKIFLDGIDTLKITPAQFTLDAGLHNYILSLVEFVSISGQIIINDNEVTNLIVTLQNESTVFYKQLITLTIIGLGVSTLAIAFRK